MDGYEGLLERKATMEQAALELPRPEDFILQRNGK
jgi:hypothetical protein